MKLYHKIEHGDSAVVLKKLRDGIVDCIITDPPYGIDNQSNSSVTQHGKAYARKIANDSDFDSAQKIFTEVFDVLIPKAKASSDIYIFTSWQVVAEWILFLKEYFSGKGFLHKAILVWEKDGPGMGDLESWGQGHEFILYFKRGNRERNAQRRSGVIHTPQIRPDKLIHPHEKPEPLLELLIRHSTEEGDVLVDPFGGSGSLVRAARNISRSALAVELDEYNYKQADKKLNEMVGLF